MNGADEREPDALPEHARRVLAHHRDARAMPDDAFARVHRGLQREHARTWTGPVAIAVAVAAVVLLMWGLRGWQRASRSARNDAPSMSNDRIESEPARAATTTPATPATLPAVPPAATMPAELPVPGVEPRVRKPARVDVPTPDTAPSSIGSSLAAERELLALAWAALTEGAPQRALQVVAEHRDRFADGALVPERDAIAAIARCRTTTVGRAAQAEAFAQAHRGSPLLERVRTACVEDSHTP